MDGRPIPLVILGGSDRCAGRLPASGAGQHPLSGYKGVALRFGGRPMLSLLLERVRAVPALGPVFVAGPREAYGRAIEDAALIDTDGSFGANLEAAVEAVRRACPGSSIAFLTCDVVPDADALARLLLLHREAGPSDFFFPQVRCPEDPARLGASQWKPKYLLVEPGSASPTRVLPGHLVIVDPRGLRLEFMYRLFQLAYRHRNRSIARRRNAFLRALIAWLLLADLRRVAALRAPDVTFSVLGAGLPAAARLRRGTLTVAAAERALRRLFVTREHRRAHPDHRVVIPIVEELSLAVDIDTAEEARALGGEVGNAAGGA